MIPIKGDDQLSMQASVAETGNTIEDSVNSQVGFLTPEKIDRSLIPSKTNTSMPNC